MYQKELTLLDDSQITIRPARLSDYVNLWYCTNQVNIETPFLTREEEERIPSTEHEFQFLKKFFKQERSLMLCVLHKDKIVGIGRVEPIGDKYRVKHRCKIGIALLQKYCGFGIGTELLLLLLTFARDNNYYQVEADIHSDNERSIRMCMRYGFEVVGCIPDAIRYKDGSMKSELLLRRKL